MPAPPPGTSHPTHVDPARSAVEPPPTAPPSAPLTAVEQWLSQPLADFVALPPTERARVARETVADLHFFVDEGRAFEEREAPERSISLARSLHGALADPDGASDELAQRIVTDEVLRTECDRDQNVYLGKLFTRRLSQAVPDVLFLPETAGEVAAALTWARAQNVPVTLRGAASTAMGGAIPSAGGLALDFAKLDRVVIERARGTVRFGAGARMRPLHRTLHEAGLALPVYPSNLGGTYAGWLATGGIGMNAYAHGRALDPLRAAQVVLPDGRLLRLSIDGGAEEHSEGDWRPMQEAPLKLQDLAGSEGQFGALIELEVATEALPDLAGFLLAFSERDAALESVRWIDSLCSDGLDAPADVKLLSGSHLHHVQAVWREEDGKRWRGEPSARYRDAELPWARVIDPGELGASVEEANDAQAYLFVDFLSEAAGRAFVERLRSCPGTPRVHAQSRRFTLDRFRPQQVKRLGPGFLAAEILMPAKNVGAYQPRAEKLAEDAGTELDLEVYHLADGTALAIAGYLTDHRKGSFHVDLLLAPALLDLAIAVADARPYVLGRWQANLLRRKLGPAERARLIGLKEALDPGRIVNRGSFFQMGLRGPLGRALELTMGPAVRTMRTLVGLAPPLARIARKWMQALPGPAAERGDSISEQVFQADQEPSGSLATGRAIHCVNCGECNSVCPIFQESKVRLPQMLTHLGESLHGGEGISNTASTLLDLCMRCGNCEEVCQAGIPHLPLYDAMQEASDKERPYRRDRHVLLLERLRGSEHYTRAFLDARPGGYILRTPASLSGDARFQLLRAEGEAGPAETCIHCGACVDVCPTSANREYEGDDPRWITTVQSSCIGCGTCVEVCPANIRNGGRTLRVMEAPTLDWFDAVAEFTAREETRA